MKLRDLFAHALLALAVKVGSPDFARWLLDAVKRVDAERTPARAETER